MKLTIILLLVINSAFASVHETFVGENITINGLRVSARKHWNFRAYATADYHFCKFMGFDGAIRSETIVKTVPPQRMTFFTAFLSDNANGIVALEDETKQLEQVVCTKN